MPHLTEPFWRRYVRRLLIGVWIPAIALAAVGTAGGGSRGSLIGFVGTAVILYLAILIFALMLGPFTLPEIEKAG